VTPREPDRFEAKARELVHRVDGMTYGHSDDDRAAVVAAALRAAAFAPLGDNHHNAAACPYCGDLLSREKVKAESSALERAAQEVERCGFDNPKETAEAIRSLIPPAAAHAAGPCLAECASRMPDYSNHVCTRWKGHAGPHGESDVEWTDKTTVPAAETGKAPAPWRVGSHYGIHVYEDQRPVATFHREEDAPLRGCGERRPDRGESLMPREVTRMRDGFKVGDRVRWSLEGQQANLPGAGTGRVTGFGYRPGMLIVRPDGRKTASAYAIEFWELEKPEGGEEVDGDVP
jgi:hypothetical protein